MDLIPPELGARVMAAARARRAPGYSVESGPVAADAAEVYREGTDLVAAALADLPDEGWHRTVAPYPWSVHDLLSHLLAAERYTAARLGVPGVGALPAPEDDDHSTFADATIAAERLRPPTDTLADWWDVVGRVRAVARPGAVPQRAVAFHGLAMEAPTLLVVRGFELWIHAEDVSRAMRTAGAIPSAPALRSMAELSVETLVPMALPAVRTAPAAQLRVILTGPGGGTWNLRLGEGQASAMLVLDVVDYCRHAARRHGRAELQVDIEGDAELAEDVLTASRLFSV